MSLPCFRAEGTRDGELPPWEIAKGYALHCVLNQASEVLGVPCYEMLGQRVDEYIAQHLVLKGGGNPTPRAVRKVVQRCSDPTWFPGKPSEQRLKAGRKEVFSAHQKNEVARVAMDLKRNFIAPTPRRVRARLPQVSRNPVTGLCMSDKTMHRIYSERCYDETEDDPWIYLASPSQDALDPKLKPLRVCTASHILANFPASAWFYQIGIDPCYSLLAKTEEKQVEQKIAAMGVKKWMSKGSSRKGANLRAPATANTQASSSVRVDWTPIFARGKLRIYVVDDTTANDTLPTKLADANNLSKFIRNVLPHALQDMKTEYGWADVPRTIVHDKASYMVTACHETLHVKFAQALASAGFRSWIGTGSASTKWLVKKFGDVFLHETVIAHIRRLLATDFICERVGETPAQFKQRMKRVENYMNSEEFADSDGGRGLLGLAKSLRHRCQKVVDAGGERIPK